MGREVNRPVWIFNQKIWKPSDASFYVADSVFRDLEAVARKLDRWSHDCGPRQFAVFLMEVLCPSQFAGYTTKGKGSVKSVR